jgi:hypothetical protein
MHIYVWTHCMCMSLLCCIPCRCCTCVVCLCDACACPDLSVVCAQSHSFCEISPLHSHRKLHRPFSQRYTGLWVARGTRSAHPLTLIHGARARGDRMGQHATTAAQRDIDSAGSPQYDHHVPYIRVLAFNYACELAALPARLVIRHDDDTVISYTREDSECHAQSACTAAMHCLLVL